MKAKIKNISIFTILFLYIAAYANGQQNEFDKTVLKLEAQEPISFFDAAASKFGAGEKKEGAFLFYLGQLRARYYLKCNPVKAKPADLEAYNAVQVVIGGPINGYLGDSMALWVDVIQQVLDWTNKHDYTICPKSKDPKAYKETLDGLKELLGKIKTMKEKHLKKDSFSYLPGFDFKLFKNTPLASLAHAVEYQDTKEIARILRAQKPSIDEPEPKFGHTLLMLAAADGKAASVKKLLELGADPNKYDRSGKYNALQIVCEYARDDCDTEILHLLLTHGADVNARPEKKYAKTPLMLAAEGYCLNIVKALVNGGADINAYTDFEGNGAITCALIQQHLDVVKYLLIEKHATVPKYCYVRDLDPNNITKLTITDMLMEADYSGNRAMQIQKEEIINFLREKGLK